MLAQAQAEIDVAGRSAGTGSLGLKRYIVLIGDGSPDNNHLLDLKQAQPSSLSPYIQFPQPRWNNEVERIIAIQQRIQVISPSWLNAIQINDDFFVMREYQPCEEIENLDIVEKQPQDLEIFMRTLGRVFAWSQLRSSGRQGSAIAAELIEFSQDSQWSIAVIDYAEQYSQKVIQDWHEFFTRLPI